MSSAPPVHPDSTDNLIRASLSGRLRRYAGRQRNIQTVRAAARSIQ